MNPPREPDRRRYRRIGIECINFNLRRAARISGRLYDRALQPHGLTAVQFSLLTVLGAGRRPLAVTELARALSMERTTLTRDLRVLRENDWVDEEQHTDRRKRLLRLTAAGAAKLNEALPARDRAQRRLEGILGRDDWKTTRRNLKRMIRGESEL